MDGAGDARSRGADRLEDAAEEASYWGGAAATHAPRAPPTWSGSAPGPTPAALTASAADAELALELKAQGNKLLQSGQTEAAEIVYTEALKHDPAAHTVLANRALARCKLGRMGDAVADAKQAVTLAPSWSKGHARLGACLHAALRYNDAVAAFERAAWLARAHDNDDVAQQEYEAASMAAKTAAMTRGPRRGEARDGF